MGICTLSEDQLLYIKENYATSKTKDIASFLGITERRVIYYGCKFKIRKKKYLTKSTYLLNHYYFDNIGPDQSYHLGLLMSDGNVYKNQIRFEIQQNDIELLERFKLNVESDRPIRQNIKKKECLGYKSNDSCTFCINSSYMVNRLKILGVIERKTGKETFPTECIPYKWDFLRGMIDGDGSICSFTSGAGRLMNNVRIYSSSITFLE